MTPLFVALVTGGGSWLVSQLTSSIHTEVRYSQTTESLTAANKSMTELREAVTANTATCTANALSIEKLTTQAAAWAAAPQASLTDAMQLLTILKPAPAPTPAPAQAQQPDLLDLAAKLFHLQQQMAAAQTAAAAQAPAPVAAPTPTPIKGN